MSADVLKTIQGRLDLLETRFNALFVKEEPATKSELRAIRAGKREFAQGKRVSLDEILTKSKLIQEIH